MVCLLELLFGQSSSCRLPTTAAAAAAAVVLPLGCTSSTKELKNHTAFDTSATTLFGGVGEEKVVRVVAVVV